MCGAQVLSGIKQGNRNRLFELYLNTCLYQRWGLESDSSPDLVGLGLESHTFGLGLDSDFVIEVIKTLKEF